MMAEGNGNAEICVRNLLMTSRGEAPMDRCRGLDAELTGKPVGEAAGLLAADAVWLLENYEPRIEQDEIILAADEALSGKYSIRAEVRT